MLYKVSQLHVSPASEISEINHNCLELHLMIWRYYLDVEDKIIYKQWYVTVSKRLVTVQSTADGFIEILRRNKFELCHYHFIKVW